MRPINSCETMRVTFYDDNGRLKGVAENTTTPIYLERWQTGKRPLPGQSVLCRIKRVPHAGRQLLFATPIWTAAELLSIHEQLRLESFLDCAKVEPIIVSRIEQKSCFIRQSDNRLYVDEHFVGYIDNRTTTQTGRVRILEVTLSNRQVLRVHEHTLQVITKWHKGRCPDKLVEHKSFLELSSFNHNTTLSFEECSTLVPEQQIAYQVPFQKFERWVTNGEIWLPSERPTGVKAWRTVPFTAMSHNEWKFLLQALNGKVVMDVIAYYNGDFKVSKQPRKQLSTRQKGVAEVVLQASAGEIWQAETCATVSVGRNVIFHVLRNNQPTLFVVDNPGIGAIYVYGKYDDALGLAEGRVARSQAMKQNVVRVIHRGNWKGRLLRTLTSKAS